MHGLKTLCILFVAAFVQQCASVDHHVIELLMVVDYSAFKNWFDKTPSNTTVNDRVTKTKKTMVEYITSLIKTSNDVYKSLEQHNIYIQIKLIGVMFSMHASTSPWTEKVKVQDKDLDYIDPKKALPIVKSFSRSVQASRPHDHAMVLTRYDLDFGDGNKFSGYAYEAAECTTKSVSVVQDKDGFYTAQLIAHEIGHSLGCKHDRDNNTCPGSDGFAMTPSFIFANKNKWTFSSCSVAYIRNFLQSLNKNNCLLVTKSSMSNAHIVSKYYGQQYTVDEQCKIRFGVDSYFCRRPYIIHNNFSEVCLKMECYDRSRDKCYWIDGGDRTPCGNRKWCMLNNCLADSRAPSVRDDCPVGDQSGIVMNGMTCRQLLATDPHACFKDDVRYKCCDTCGQQTSTIVSLDQQCVYKL